MVFWLGAGGRRGGHRGPGRAFWWEQRRPFLSACPEAPGAGGEESLPQQPAPPIAAAAQGRAGKGRLSRLETPEPRFEQQRGKKKKESCNFINNFT